MTDAQTTPTTNDVQVRTDVTDDGVCTITLDNPARRNAWNPTMETQYFAALDRAAADEAVRAIVRHRRRLVVLPRPRLATPRAGGRPGRPAARGPALAALPARRSRSRWSRRSTARAPASASCRPSCATCGSWPAARRLSTAYAKLGIPAEYGLSWLLPRMIGIEWSLDLLLSARRVDGDEAQRIGLVTRVCDDDTVLAEAQAYAAHARHRQLAAGDGRDPPPGLGRPQPRLHRGQRALVRGDAAPQQPRQPRLRRRGRPRSSRSARRASPRSRPTASCRRSPRSRRSDPGGPTDELMTMDPRYSPDAEAFRTRVQAFLAEHLPADWQGIGALPEARGARVHRAAGAPLLHEHRLLARRLADASTAAAGSPSSNRSCSSRSSPRPACRRWARTTRSA